MSLVIQSPNKKEREIPNPGYYNAVCVDAVNLGIQPDYRGEEKKRVRLVFELEEKDSTGRGFILYRTYTASLHERSSLREDLETWRGRPFREDELESGFDLEQVVEKCCELQISHKEYGETIFAQIVSVNPAKINVEPSGEYMRVNDR